MYAFPSSSDLQSYNSEMRLLTKKWLLVNAGLEMLRDMKESLKIDASVYLISAVKGIV